MASRSSQGSDSTKRRRERIVDPESFSAAVPTSTRQLACPEGERSCSSLIAGWGFLIACAFALFVAPGLIGDDLVSSLMSAFGSGYVVAGLTVIAFLVASLLIATRSAARRRALLLEGTVDWVNRSEQNRAPIMSVKPFWFQRRVLYVDHTGRLAVFAAPHLSRAVLPICESELKQISGVAWDRIFQESSTVSDRG